MKTIATENDPRNMTDAQINAILERNGLGQLAEPETDTDELTEILDAQVDAENAAWDEVTHAELAADKAYEATCERWETENG